MALLPSRQALSELEIWLEGAEQEAADRAPPAESLTDVQLQLQKYRVSWWAVGLGKIQCYFVIVEWYAR